MKSAGNRLAKEAHTGAEALSNEIEGLRSSLRQLREDITHVVSHARGIGRGGANAATEGASDALDRVTSSFGQKIEQQPFQSVMIAFGAGVLFGLFFLRRR